MARARDEVQWNRISTLIATIENANRAEGKAVQPWERNPYGKKPAMVGGNTVPLNKNNIHLLKKLVQ